MKLLKLLKKVQRIHKKIKMALMSRFWTKWILNELEGITRYEETARLTDW